jgi:hypothetical protein
MRFYHRTSAENVEAILAEGFGDGRGAYPTDPEFTGVWICDVPVGVNEGGFGDVLLVVETPLELVEPYEFIEEEKFHREFLVPAELINQHAKLSVTTEYEEFAQDRFGGCWRH